MHGGLPPLPYRKAIANHIRSRILEGVTMKVIHDEIVSKFEDPPKSTQQLYKLYGDDISSARAEYHGTLGEFANQRIKEGSDRILELALRSKAGWNPSSSVTVTEGDPDATDENTSAIDELKALLGRSKTEEKDEDDD